MKFSIIGIVDNVAYTCFKGDENIPPYLTIEDESFVAEAKERGVKVYNSIEEMNNKASLM